MDYDILYERSYATPVSNSTLLPLLLLSLRSQDYMPNISNHFNFEYDYIVVGAGSAGTVVASRLSEKDCVSVLLLEAGPKYPLLTEVPAYADYFSGTNLDWNFKTVPQKHGSYAFVNRQANFPQGHCLGGNGILNGMAFVRGNHKNFDDWCAQGAKGWCFRDTYSYFLKIENFTTPPYAYNGYHAARGPINIEYPRYRTFLKDELFKAITSLGYEFLDNNAESETGFFDVYMNLKNGQRCSPTKAYLIPAAKRKNLDVVIEARVTKVLIEGNEAKGVFFLHNGQLNFVRARREVILSAGVINTAQLLMLSGVGPREELEKLNIPVYVDAPVGKNFHDHDVVQLYFTLNTPTVKFDDKLSNEDNILSYIYDREGPMSMPGHLFGSFLKGLEVSPSEDFPNFSLFFFEVIWRLLAGRGIVPEIFDKLIAPHSNETIYQCSIVDLQPASRGTVTLNSSSPFEPPLIDPNYLSDKRDLQVLADGLKVCKKVLETPCMQKLGAKPLGPLPGCEMYLNSEDDYLRCYATYMVYTYHHGVGTAKMGDPTDPTTVVDPKLRVKGVKNLRVADASVMPIITSGNIHIPTLMIGEKAADLIKQTIKDC